MKNFQLSRFGRLLKLDLLQNRKIYLNFVGGLLLGHLMLEFIAYHSKKEYDLLAYKYGTELYGELCATSLGDGLVGFFVIAMLLSVSMLFMHLSTKSKRAYYFMLPATALEKFLSRGVIWLILSPVAFVLTYFLGDGIRMAVLPLFDMHLGSSIPVVARNTYDALGEIVSLLSGRSRWINDDQAVAVAWTMLGMEFLLFACYVLGSAIFRRRAFIFTSLSLVTIGFALGMTLDGLSPISMSETGKDILLYVFLVFVWALGFANLWLSWRIFKRMQVIPRKLFRK